MDADDENLLPIEEQLLGAISMRMKKHKSYRPGGSLFEQQRLSQLAERGWVELAQDGGYVLTAKGTERVEGKKNRKTK